MRSGDVKGRGKVRTHSGLFSMGALAIALSACGGEFKLADENGVVVSGADVKLTFTDAPKTVSDKVADYKVTATGVRLSSVTSSDKVVTFTFAGTSDNIKIELATATAIKDNNDKDYVLNITIDNKAPVVVAAVVNTSSNTSTVTFDEKISAVDASKFKIDDVAATGAVIGGSGDAAGKVVLLTFDSITTDAKLGSIEVGAVTDDVSGKANSAGNQNIAGEAPIVFLDGDLTPPASATVTVNSANTVLTVTFDDALTDIDDTKFTVKDGDGADVTGGGVAFASGGVTINYTTALSAGAYTVTIAAGAVTSAGGVTTAELTGTVTVPSLEDDLVGLSVTSDADYGF